MESPGRSVRRSVSRPSVFLVKFPFPDSLFYKTTSKFSWLAWNDFAFGTTFIVFVRLGLFVGSFVNHWQVLFAEGSQNGGYNTLTVEDVSFSFYRNYGKVCWGSTWLFSGCIEWYRNNLAKNNKTRFFYGLYSEKSWGFDQLERAQCPIYVINTFWEVRKGIPVP